MLITLITPSREQERRRGNRASLDGVERDALPASSHLNVFTTYVSRFHGRTSRWLQTHSTYSNVASFLIAASMCLVDRRVKGAIFPPAFENRQVRDSRRCRWGPLPTQPLPIKSASGDPSAKV